MFSSRGNPTFIEVPDKASHFSSHKRGSEGMNSYSLKRVAAGSCLMTVLMLGAKINAPHYISGGNTAL